MTLIYCLISLVLGFLLGVYYVYYKLIKAVNEYMPDIKIHRPWWIGNNK